MNNEEKIPNKEQKSPKVELTEDNIDRCICPDCPTYNSDTCPSEKDEKIFCSIGKTSCDVNKEGCMCGGCPVFNDLDLKDGYFCVSGEAEESGEPAEK